MPGAVMSNGKKWEEKTVTLHGFPDDRINKGRYESHDTHSFGCFVLLITGMSRRRLNISGLVDSVNQSILRSFRYGKLSYFSTSRCENIRLKIIDIKHEEILIDKSEFVKTSLIFICLLKRICG
jgi:hypothetical protein